MENEALIISTEKKLRINFIICFLMLLVLGFLCFAMSFPVTKLNATATINLQQLLVLSLLGGIPGALVWTKNKMKTLVDISNIEKRLKQYKKYVRIRQSVFFVLGLFILFVHVFSIMKGALMLFMVVVALCFFIVPTRGRLNTEAHLTEPEP